ncbi:glycosyltransferase 87 family protein [Labedaea rhizosphaerae]|nr:glycosyltransferase 87 family protein [Labedaea rhizosphaerae]
MGEGTDWRRRVIAAGPWVFAGLLGLHVLSILLWPNANFYEIDMLVYQAGGGRVLDGAPLYDGPVTSGLLFTYPPFAGVLFAPFSLVPELVARFLVLGADVALLFLVSRVCWRSLTTHRGAELTRLGLFTTGLAIWLDPVRITLYLGQINVLLLAIVTWDLVCAREKWRGAGTGIAAGIKLTPLLFIPFLLLTRRFRAAAIASATFAVTVGISFVAAPRSAAQYWFHGTFLDLNRVAFPFNPGNQSINGGLLRAMGQTHAEKITWLIAAVVVGVAGMALAVVLHRKGHTLAAISMAGMLSCVVSPYSWNHHWVWPVLLLVWLLARGAYRSAAVFWLVCLGFPDEYPSHSDSNILSGWLYLPASGWPREVLHNWWVLCYLGCAVGFVLWLRRNARVAAESSVPVMV